MLTGSLPYQANDALAELRNLSRGIAPPILVDRGLDAAVEELAARSEVLTTVEAETGDLPHHVARPPISWSPRP